MGENTRTIEVVEGSNGASNQGSNQGSRSSSRNNFLAWSKSKKIALGVKNKLRFIDGKCVRPEADSGEIERWNRVDFMVQS